MTSIKYLILLLGLNSFSQLINAPGDCIDSYPLCNASATYNFQLVDWGVIDDAKGTLFLAPCMGQTAFNQCEWKSAWLKFKPRYSGDFKLRICPETVEKLQWMLCLNPNCDNIESGNYVIACQGASNIAEPIYGCTGIGTDPNFTGTGIGNWDFPIPTINLQANQNYLLFVRTALFVQTGSHRFTLTFQGQAVADHPDLFDDVFCNLSTSNQVVSNKVTIYPNPFNEKININSNIALEKTEIYDILGKNVYSEDYQNEIDSSFLATGIYFIKLYGLDNEVFVRKIVKK